MTIKLSQKFANIQKTFFIILSPGPSGCTCGQYYKPMMIVNDDSRVVDMLEASLSDDARVIIYDCHMFIVQETGLEPLTPG